MTPRKPLVSSQNLGCVGRWLKTENVFVKWVNPWMTPITVSVAIFALCLALRFACLCACHLGWVLWIGFFFALFVSRCVFWASYRCTRELDRALVAATPILPSWGNAGTPCPPTFHPVCTFCSFHLPRPQSTASACHGCFDGQGSEFLIPKLSVTVLSLAEIKMSFEYG